MPLPETSIVMFLFFQFVYKGRKLCDGVLYSKYQCMTLVSRDTLIQNGALLYYFVIKQLSFVLIATPAFEISNCMGRS